MENNKYGKTHVIILALLLLLPMLSGCRSGKKFDSPETMIAEMTGTYSGTNEHSGERVVINGDYVIKFNIDSIFPEITESDFFLENFSDEDWVEFDINTLLEKPYVGVTTESVSTNVEKSTINGLWVEKSSVLYSSNDGYAFNKVSSDAIYPTAEMQEKFEEYLRYLKEYEASAIIAEAENNLSEEQASLESALSSATSSSSSSMKSTASAETIAECAFESIKDQFKYPRTAKLDAYSTNPQYDSYGRVCTLITCTYQNGYGNYITEDVYVVLQSCSYSGMYTYKSGGMHFCKNEDTLNFLLYMNDWNEDPSTDNTKEGPYNEAIQLMKKGQYGVAANKLKALGDYKDSIKLLNVCTNYSNAKKYNDAIQLFAKGEYAKAKKELSSLVNECGWDYLKVKRTIALCTAAINNSSDNNESTSQPPATQPPETQPPETQPPATQAPTVCSHNYTAATCTTPKTCTLCGQTSGSALGHSYSTATCIAPKTCSICGATTGVALGHNYSPATCTKAQTCSACGATRGSAAGHNWREITETVFHEEQGHYGDVQVPKRVQKVQCYACSNKSDTLEEYYSHFDSVHGNSNHYLLVRERYEWVNVTTYEYETQWIVDQEAYTELVVTGRYCTACGLAE